jgi:predicted adenylyl cyclase CyaB
MNTKTIEVEVKSFITKEQYDNLLEFFHSNSTFTNTQNQDTFYFKGKNDFRIKKDEKKATIVLKKGVLHDEKREELEVNVPKEDFEKLEQLFLVLGHVVDIQWKRKRHNFLWDGINVSVDHTLGYGYILELEKMSDEENKEENLLFLKEKLQELNVKLTQRDVFEKKFSDYKENWKELINQ